MCKSTFTMTPTRLSSFFRRFGAFAASLVNFFTTRGMHHPLVVLATLIGP